MGTIGACFNYLFDEGYTTPKSAPNSEEDLRCRCGLGETQTFTQMSIVSSSAPSSYVAHTTNWMTRRCLIDNSLVIISGSVLISGMQREIRQLRWENVEVETIGGGNSKETKLARVVPINHKSSQSNILLCWSTVH